MPEEFDIYEWQNGLLAYKPTIGKAEVGDAEYILFDREAELTDYDEPDKLKGNNLEELRTKMYEDAVIEIVAPLCRNTEEIREAALEKTQYEEPDISVDLNSMEMEVVESTVAQRIGGIGGPQGMSKSPSAYWM